MIRLIQLWIKYSPLKKCSKMVSCAYKRANCYTNHKKTIFNGTTRKKTPKNERATIFTEEHAKSATIFVDNFDNLHKNKNKKYSPISLLDSILP